MNAELRPYEQYRSTGVPWIGEVPNHWRMKRAKWLYQKMARPVRESDEIVTCFRNGIVTLRKNRRLDGFTNSLKEIGYQGIRRGDLVIHAMDAFAGAVGVSDSDGKATPVYSVCTARTELDNRYYAYLVREMARSQWIMCLARGIRERSTDFRFQAFGAQTVPLPPVEEQRAIAEYLDANAAKVRRFIRNRRRLIEVLNEQKQAIINRAVTRGLGPDVSLKPSGVDWMGDIPTTWKVLRAKYLFKEVDIRSRDGSETHLSMSQKFGLVPASQLTERHFHSTSYAGGKLVNEGDIVLNRLKAHLGVFRLAEQAGVISPDYTVLRPRHRHSARYFELVLTSSAIRPDLRCRVKGLVEGFWRLYTDDFYDIRLPVPPTQEQERVVGSCKSETAELDAAIRTAEREIDLIREYRTRLIADVVTGKVDVRHLAPPPDRQNAAEIVEDLEPLDDAAGELDDDAVAGEVVHADD